MSSDWVAIDDRAKFDRSPLATRAETLVPSQFDAVMLPLEQEHRRRMFLVSGCIVDYPYARTRAA